MNKRVLVAGATGYVGGRLIAALEGAGYQVRAMARRPEHLQGRVAPATEIVQADVLDPDSLKVAMRNVDVAFYLIHSMGSRRSFVHSDRVAAENFARAAEANGVQRMIYLGGLGSGKELSAHLASRQEVGRILRESNVPTIEFRASAIIGSGSLSFDLVRALVQKLPVMIVPRWVFTLSQPIAIEDVIAYLMESITIDLPKSEVFEIGGADQVTYAELMKEYARQRGLRRYMIRVPVLTPRLSSLWLGLVTPLQARVGRKLVDSLIHETIVTDRKAQDRFTVRPRGVADAIARALVREDREFAQTRWSDAISSSSERSWGGVPFGTRLVDSRAVTVACSPQEAFRPIERIGGTNGYYIANWLWAIRGFIDRLVGGVGLRRGRRDPQHLYPGEALDFWRVEAVEPNRLLRLRAEMRLPGRAWLQFEVEPDGERCVIRQTAIFDPVGLAGLMYWYGIWPLHQFVFAGMLHGIAKAAISQTSSSALMTGKTP
jgi:uncharacterized protein YbjT (DUF2867 family)